MEGERGTYTFIHIDHIHGDINHIHGHIDTHIHHIYSHIHIHHMHHIHHIHIYIYGERERETYTFRDKGGREGRREEFR